MKKLVFIAALLLLIPVAQAAHETDVQGWTPTSWASELTPALAAQAEVCYQFNEGSGTAAIDSSDSANNATLQGNAAYTTGKFGYGMAFDGEVGTYLSVDSTLLLWPTELTIMAWVYHDPDSGRDHTIASAYGYFTFDRDYSLVSESHINNGTSVWNKNDDDGTVHASGEWIHLAMTYEGDRGDGLSEVKYYYNGVLDGSCTWTPSYTNIAHKEGGYVVQIGNQSGVSDRMMEGYLDDVAIFYDVLEFEGLGAGNTIPDPNWVVEYPAGGELLLHMNETSGDTAYDSSGNGRDATVYDNNAPVWSTEGRYNGALFFDRETTNDYADATYAKADLNISGWTEFTMEAWIKLDQDPVIHQDILALKGYVYLYRYRSKIGTNDITKLYAQFSDGAPANGYCQNGTTPISKSDGWVHVATTYKTWEDGGTTYSRARIYVNGKLDEESIWTGGRGYMWTDGYDDLYIGRNDPAFASWDNPRRFSGWMDEVRVVNKELEFSPFPAGVGVVELPNTGINMIGLSDGWNQTVLWQEDAVSYPNVLGCQIFDGTTQYSIAEAETAGLISGTLYTLDGATQSYVTIPGTGGDFVNNNDGYFMWTYQPNLQLLMPLQ